MARKFAGGTDIITSASTSVLNFNYTSPLSISFWMKQTSATNVIWLSNLGAATTYTGWEIGRGGGINQQPYFLLSSDFTGNNYMQTITSTEQFTANGVWYAVGLTYTGSGSSLGVVHYTNGIAQTTQNLHSPVSASTQSGIAATIGARPGGSTPSSDALADVAVWNVVLTAGEMAALNAGIRPWMIRPKSIVSYWPLDGLQSPEPDLSGNVNNGTVTGTTLAAGPPATMFTPRWPLNTPVSAPSAIFRKSASRIGTRTGTRQTWAA